MKVTVQLAREHDYRIYTLLTTYSAPLSSLSHTCELLGVCRYELRIRCHVMITHPL